ncbi:MAG: outer membrane lipoprotein chaperone LolA [bacterium]
MTYFLLIAIFIVNAFSFYFLPELIASSVRAKDIIKKVKQKYESLESLKADFEQVYSWELAGETQTLKGTIFLKSGNNYRIETESQIIVTDGKTVWTYSESNQQVIIDLLTKSEENPLPKDLLFKYSEDFTPHLVGEEKIEGKKTYLLNLVPKDEEAFIKSMKIWVEASSWLTIKIEQIDINDNVNTYYVRNVKQNIQLDDSLFTFEIPPDTEVVDLR